jgi:hypothetical protein
MQASHPLTSSSNCLGTEDFGVSQYHCFKSHLFQPGGHKRTVAFGFGSACDQPFDCLDNASATAWVGKHGASR